MVVVMREASIAADTHRESDHRFVIGSVNVNGLRRFPTAAAGKRRTTTCTHVRHIPPRGSLQPVLAARNSFLGKAGPGRPPRSRPENPRQELTVAGEPTAGDLQNPRWRLLHRGFRTVG